MNMANLFSKDLDLHGLGDVVDDEDVTLGSANLHLHPDDGRKSGHEFEISRF